MSVVASGFSFIQTSQFRLQLRSTAIFIYFVIFQALILLQKPFLQLEFIYIFYLCFGVLFTTHFVMHMQADSKELSRRKILASYLLDFLIMILFMRNFHYLSSFVLVLQLFFLFIASFDLDFMDLCVLGFVASMGSSLINLSVNQAGALQGILSLTLFNLSYISVIVVSQQLRSEFFYLQTDLTDVKKKWKSQEDFSKTLLEKVPMGLLLTQKNNQFLLKNSYLSESIKIEDEELSRVIHKYNEITDGQFINCDVQSKFQNNEKNITFNVDRTEYFDEDMGENLDIYLLRNVTEIRELEGRVRQSEKLAAVGQLAAGIAHEIRNPLAGISGSIQLLSQDAVDPTQKKLMQIVLKEIDRLNGLISEFLDYAKPEKKPENATNLTRIIEDVYASLRTHPEVLTEMVWELKMENIEIYGIAEKLKQAILNILINAIQAMKESAKPVLSIQLYKEDNFAILKIKDTGCGMKTETRKKMFEPFHTTKNRGTGLGLAITHKILEMHQAHVEVKSEVGAGTEFIIKMPLFQG